MGIAEKKSEFRNFAGYLRSSTFLGALPPASVDTLLKTGHTQHYPKGKIIFERGDPGDYLLVVLEGQVKISNVTSQGREVILNLLGVGDLNGEIAVLDGGGRSATATALEDTEAFVLFRRDLLPILKENPSSLLEIMSTLCEKLRQTSAMVEYAQRSMQARFASSLLRLASQHGRKSNAGILIDFRLNQRDLGNYAGLSRENTNRLLHFLSASGLILLAEGRIMIRDENALRELAESQVE
jgi:CRP/FNR family transcriptional regulator, cyclic AMP receptor protein